VNESEVKAFESFEIKDAATGEVEAIIATLGVVDRDYDVIMEGAVKDGSKVKMSAYGHDVVGFIGPGKIPVGKGLVFEEKGKLVFRGRVFVTTPRGQEAIAVLKEMGKDQEWSFGYRVMGEEVPDEEWTRKGARRMITKADVFEVSPVLIGAGIGTRTVSAKQASTLDREASALAAQFARITERHATPAGVPLPPRFRPAVEFAAKQLAMYRSQIPPVKLVAAGSIRDGAVGCYLVESKAILVVARGDDEDTRRTIFHEMVHHYENLKGWVADEAFADLMEGELSGQWSREWREWT
jgi:prohead serine protease